MRLESPTWVFGSCSTLLRLVQAVLCVNRRLHDEVGGFHLVAGQEVVGPRAQDKRRHEGQQGHWVPQRSIPRAGLGAGVRRRCFPHAAPLCRRLLLDDVCPGYKRDQRRRDVNLFTSDSLAPPHPQPSLSFPWFTVLTHRPTFLLRGCALCTLAMCCTAAAIMQANSLWHTQTRKGWPLSRRELLAQGATDSRVICPTNVDYLGDSLSHTCHLGLTPVNSWS